MASDDDYRTPPARQLMAIYKAGEHSIISALHDWYSSEEKDFKLFSKKYYVDEEILKIQNVNLKAMHDWCISNEIVYTPTFFINGYQVPRAYSASDLKYFLSE